MMRKNRSTDSASPDSSRMLAYREFARAFTYPDDENLARDYDLLFRSKEIWPYITEYISENEFQRTQQLSDIMGFYRAFAVEPDKDRPDSLSAALEFMYYLIFKQNYALAHNIKNAKEKVLLCLDAQRKFFNTYLYPAAKEIAKKIISQENARFYKKPAGDMLNFLETEKAFYAHSQVEMVI